MFDNLLSQMQEQANEIKKKLDKITVEAEAENGLVKVTATGNKKILSIDIDPAVSDDKETIEDLVIVAVNRVLEKADEIASKETGDLAQDMFPGLGNIFG